MSFLIDGHNLIPMVGLSLDSLDDELQLVQRLQEFCRLSRVKVEVYFDGAPPGHAGTRRVGGITVHFVRKASSADVAIENRLIKMRRSARNWTVVSSDKRVKAAAQAAQAATMNADDFAAEMVKVKAKGLAKPEAEPSPTPGEVDEWLEIFSKRGGEKIK